jgi:hypothetical protein
MYFASGHLDFDEPENCRKYRAGYAAACGLTDKWADVDRTRGVGQHWDERPENLPANAAAYRANHSLL